MPTDTLRPDLPPAGGIADKEGNLDVSGRRILVADDNPVNLQVAVRMLERLGCQAEAVTNGNDAVAMHSARAYELILMDCQMPELDGYLATAQIRAMEIDGRRTPIIAMTAFGLPSEHEKCLTCGMDDVMPKPVRLPMLKNMLERWLRPILPTQPQSGDELEVVRAEFREDFAELAELYLTDGPKRIAMLRAAAQTGDHAMLAKAAHVFAGSCASIGATLLCTLCKELEIWAKREAGPDCRERLATIEAEYGRIDAKLRRMIQAA